MDLDKLVKQFLLAVRRFARGEMPDVETELDDPQIHRDPAEIRERPPAEEPVDALPDVEPFQVPEVPPLETPPLPDSVPPESVHDLLPSQPEVDPPLAVPGVGSIDVGEGLSLELGESPAEDVQAVDVPRPEPLPPPELSVIDVIDALPPPEPESAIPPDEPLDVLAVPGADPLPQPEAIPLPEIEEPADPLVLPEPIQTRLAEELLQAPLPPPETEERLPRPQASYTPAEIEEAMRDQPEVVPMPVPVPDAESYRDFTLSDPHGQEQYAKETDDVNRSARHIVMETVEYQRQSQKAQDEINESQYEIARQTAADLSNHAAQLEQVRAGFTGRANTMTDTHL